MSLSLEDYAPPAKPMAVHTLENPGSATFVWLPARAFEDWHPAPHRQLAVIVRGTVEVTAGDGAARPFGPGSMILLEDTTGSGHQTRVIGDDDSLTLMIVPRDD